MLVKKCATCSGSGHIAAPDGSEHRVTCPECNGEGEKVVGN